jgi:hypothetical protein
MEQGFPSREEKPQTLDLFKFFEYFLNLFYGKILMGALWDITVTALEITPIGDLKFEIAERRGWGGV